MFIHISKFFSEVLDISGYEMRDDKSKNNNKDKTDNIGNENDF